MPSPGRPAVRGVLATPAIAVVALPSGGATAAVLEPLGRYAAGGIQPLEAGC